MFIKYFLLGFSILSLCSCTVTTIFYLTNNSGDENKIIDVFSSISMCLSIFLAIFVIFFLMKSICKTPKKLEDIQKNDFL